MWVMFLTWHGEILSWKLAKSAFISDAIVFTKSLQKKLLELKFDSIAKDNVLNKEFLNNFD